MKKFLTGLLGILFISALLSCSAESLIELNEADTQAASDIHFADDPELQMGDSVSFEGTTEPVALVNAGFETVWSGTTTAPSGWLRSSTSTSFTTARNTAYKSSGTASLALGSTTSTSFYVYQEVAVKANTSYTASAKFYDNGNSKGCLYIYYYNGTTQLGYTVSAYTVNSASWQTIAKSFTTPANTTKIQLCLRRYDDPTSARATIYVDDVELVGPATQTAATYNASATSGMTVYFKKPSSWSTAKIYYWNTTPATASIAWSGVAMTSVGDGWYSYTFTNVTTANIIFNNNGSPQTADLVRTGTGYYWTNNKWYDTNPETPATNSVFKVYFKKPSAWSTVKIYYWNTTPASGAVTWPGLTTVSEGNNWFSYTFTNITAANLIFNNNGSPQTADLTRNKTGYYWTNNQWYDNNPEGSSSSSSSSSSTSSSSTTSSSTTSSSSSSTTSSSSSSSSSSTVSGLKVHVKKPSAWSTAYIYYWATTPVVASVTWPGRLMISEGNGWYYYIITNVSAASIIFNNNGSPQTANLSRDKEGWYWTNNQWYDGNPEDTVLPTCTLTAPANGASISGNTTVSATATDNIGIAKVEFYYDTTKIGEDTTSPYSMTWNTTTVPNGSHTVKAIAYDYAGNNKASTTVSVMTSNPNIAPVANAGPDLYGTVGATIFFDASASYDPNGTITNYSWNNGMTGKNPTKVYTAKGTYTVTLTVTDNEGAKATDTVVVNISDASSGSTDFREETIYFLMTTRFYDGDPANNVHCWDDAQAQNPDSDPAWRGDFEGLIQKLDYIKALGFSAVWVTPVVKNSSGYDYHGYHAINFKEVDPRYKCAGDATAEASYQRFINAAHAKGMKVIQDIVLNHTGNFGEENLYPMFRRKAPTGLNESAASALEKILPSKLPANYDSLTPGQQYQARIALMKEDANDTAFLYHHEKSMSWESYTVQTGQIAGDCVDLNTENPTTAQYLIEAYNKYIGMGVDSFRVDTVKHISRLTFNKYFVPAFKQAGGEKFYIFGEVCTRYRQVWNNGIPAISSPFFTWKETVNYSWGSRTVNEASVFQNWQDNSTTANQPSSGNHYLDGNNYRTPDWSRRSGMDVIDFPMHWNFNNARDAFGVAVGNDHTYNDATWNVTYVDSHDYAPDGAPENQRFAGSQGTWAENLSLMFTFRGIPCIYYGSEIEFQKGKAIDVGPNAPLSQTGRAYFGDHITGSISVSGFGQYSSATGNIATTLNHPLAQHIRRLNLIRRAVPALQKGQYSTSDISGGGMAFKRRFTDSAKGIDSFVLVTISGDATFYNLPAGTYRDAITGDTKTVSAGGSLSTSGCWGQGNARIYVLNGTGKIGDNGTYLK